MKSIPKVIHYCWFGGKPLPKSAEKCIESWKNFFPNYEIKQWNESNYDVHKILYISQAYDAKKYAFVSDYARFDILYNNGGLYFDTDVEAISSFDDILNNGAFMGLETDLSNGQLCQVNPGLGLGLESRNPICGEILEYYSSLSFLLPNGDLNTETIVKHTTRVLKQYGLMDIDGIQSVKNISIYPKEYFNPYNEATGKLLVTDKTHSIHWYTASWQTPKGRVVNALTRPVRRVLGEDFFIKVKDAFGKK